MFYYRFMLHALLGALLSGLSLAIFAPYVTLRRISYMGEALSHIAFAGIAIAILFGLNLTFSTLVFVVIISMVIGWISRKHKLQEANTISIFLSVSMALGIVLISVSKNYSFDLASYLFGNVLLITESELYSLVGLNILNLAFVLIFYKELFYLTYNAEMAKVFRIRTGLVNQLFLVLLAANIVINLKSAGIILVTAQLILPAVIAFNFVHYLHRAIVVSAIVAFISAIIGFALSFKLNLPTGATIVLFEAFIYFVSLGIRGKNHA
ncbi:MAG: metal ABC transporter permease [Candidatus Cloacimonetes bacterium]|nr:metal ABC transporter permease [Candidatus Cloacimonadota bacterium]